MQITTVELSPIATIAAKAAFLSERLDHFHHNVNSEIIDKNLIAERIQNWCKFLGGEDKLHKRLQWDRLDIKTVHQLLGTTKIIDNSTLPMWAETLNNLVQAASISLINIKEKSPIYSNNSLPFEDFYLPFILVARQKIYTQLFPIIPLELMSKTAYDSLERSLLKQLANIGSKTLLFEFYKFRENQSLQNQIFPQDNQSTVLYDAFIQKLLQDGGLTLFEQYPVLARLIATTVDYWVESTAEFIQRLQTDLSTIQLTFSEHQILGKVRDIETSLSEAHHGGRCVLVLTFTPDIKVVYKPKDLGLDIAFQELLQWCNQQDISLPFKLTKIINHREYGWFEFIEHKSCEDIAAVKHFYKRAGMLLSLLYILGAKNCDNENIIANGEYPILIDADILMHPQTTTWDTLQEWFENSVLRTGFLPAWKGNIASANPQDSSVLGGIYSQQINSSREWKFMNTDEMQLVPKSTIIPPRANLVVLEEKTVSPNDYVEEIVTGFNEIFDLLLKNREYLLGENSPLSAFKYCESRFILRPSITYGLISKHSLSPQYLGNGVDYSIAIDALSRFYLTAEEKPETWVILSTEIKCLQQQDIPYFSLSCDSDALEIGINQPIKYLLKNSSYQRLISQLENLDQKELALQIKLIRGSFYARFTHLAKNNTAPKSDFSQFYPLTPEELLQEAINIGNSLVDSAIWHDDSCNWLALELMFNANRHQLQLLNDSLYIGRAGVSLFLSALAKITGKSEFQEISLAALQPLRKSLNKKEISRELLHSGLGATGLGGIIYSLVKISQFLEEPALLENAQQVAQLITKKVIDADKVLDTIGGVTGAIVGLLALYQETGEQAILDRAIDCGNHLLSTRINTFPRAWKTITKTPLTGFSHGAAGNSFALLLLYSATGNASYLEAAKEGTEYERSVFDKSAQNWPDFRFFEEKNQIHFLSNWCHGSVGIGLARLGSLPILQTEEIYPDIDIALKTTQENGISSRDRDHLCCGILGRTELFVVAFQKLGNQELLKTARKQAAWVLKRAKQNGEYTFLSPSPNSILSPSFFQGTAGVGYQFLRLAFPESLPSVLIWE
ncbi:MAG: type 2 lanthipeptide synthetase LanM family protein [Nostocaceae cyanobacterium]|nr:type 2 lanthipeptide synthetase LanM family protein [Nostocaceae cyanobacterium]